LADVLFSEIVALNNLQSEPDYFLLAAVRYSI